MTDRDTLNAMARGDRYSMPAGAIMGAGYSIGRARYAKAMLAVRTPSSTGYMTPAGYAMREVNARWSNREGAWIASPSKVLRFLEIMGERDA